MYTIGILMKSVLVQVAQFFPQIFDNLSTTHYNTYYTPRAILLDSSLRVAKIGIQIDCHAAIAQEKKRYWGRDHLKTQAMIVNNHDVLPENDRPDFRLQSRSWKKWTIFKLKTKS